MDTKKDLTLLRIFASSTDKIGPQLFYEKIVFLAREKGLTGATVFRGIMGYGASSIIHSSRFWELTEKLPVVIEIIDETEKTDMFFELIKPYLDEMAKGCLVTREKADVVFYKTGK